MKKIKHIKSTVILSLVLIMMAMSVNSCSADKPNQATEVHVEDDHDDHPLAEKIVELTQQQYQLTNITLGDFQLKNMSEVLNVNGYTKLPPRNQADVSVHVGGLIKSIRVLEGQYVKKGQTVATMESPEFAKLHQAYLSSKSNLAYLKEDYKRQTALQTDEVNAKKVVQKVKSDLEIEEAQFNALAEQLRLLNINPEGKISTIVPIRAPISGHLTDVFVKIGSAVSPNMPLFSLVDNSEMHIDLLVYEKDLYKVKVGQKLRFVLTNQSHTEINGTIFNIGKSFENETKSVAVHAHIDDHDVELIPGMYINALIDVGSHQAQTLPSEAIIEDLGRKYIFVLESGKHAHGNDENHDDLEGHDNSTEEGHEHEEEIHDDHDHAEANGHANHYDFRRIEVKTGAEQLGSVEVNVMGTLKPSDKIVVAGAYYLQSHLQKNDGNGGGHSH